MSIYIYNNVLTWYMQYLMFCVVSSRDAYRLCVCVLPMCMCMGVLVLMLLRVREREREREDDIRIVPGHRTLAVYYSTP